MSPVNCVTFYNDPQEALYVGMDVGVYYIDSTLSQYETFMEGLPNVIVSELEINYINNKIRAGTYGRGLWESDIHMSEPIANFEADHTLIPTGHHVNFVSLSFGPPTIYEWTFEGGTPSTSNEMDPGNIVYSEEGTFDVTLTVTNALGSNTIIKEDYITSSTTLMPDVDFKADVTAICLDDKIEFTDLTQHFPISWEWEITPETFTFVDGTNSNSQNPHVELHEYGNYSVTLTAYNANGPGSETKTDFVNVGGYAIPYEEDFETVVLDEVWTIETPNEKATWELAEVGGNEPGVIAARVNFREIVSFGQVENLIFTSSWPISIICG